MAIILRLQGLPWSASAMDIRNFFAGLDIPVGGVHIVGGESGDVFIAFNSDKDASTAMRMQDRPLCGSKITILLSSKAEMHEVITQSRTGQQPRRDVFQAEAEVSSAANVQHPSNSSTESDIMSSRFSQQQSITPDRSMGLAHGPTPDRQGERSTDQESRSQEYPYGYPAQPRPTSTAVSTSQPNQQLRPPFDRQGYPSEMTPQEQYYRSVRMELPRSQDVISEGVSNEQYGLPGMTQQKMSSQNISSAQATAFGFQTPVHSAMLDEQRRVAALTEKPVDPALQHARSHERSPSLGRSFPPSSQDVPSAATNPDQSQAAFPALTPEFAKKVVIPEGLPTAEQLRSLFQLQNLPASNSPSTDETRKEPPAVSPFQGGLENQRIEKLNPIPGFDSDSQQLAGQRTHEDVPPNAQLSQQDAYRGDRFQQEQWSGNFDPRHSKAADFYRPEEGPGAIQDLNRRDRFPLGQQPGSYDPRLSKPEDVYQSESRPDAQQDPRRRNRFHQEQQPGNFDPRQANPEDFYRSEDGLDAMQDPHRHDMLPLGQRPSNLDPRRSKPDSLYRSDMGRDAPKDPRREQRPGSFDPRYSRPEDLEQGPNAMQDPYRHERFQRPGSFDPRHSKPEDLYRSGERPDAVLGPGVSSVMEQRGPTGQHDADPSTEERGQKENEEASRYRAGGRSRFSESKPQDPRIKGMERFQEREGLEKASEKGRTKEFSQRRDTRHGYPSQKDPLGPYGQQEYNDAGRYDGRRDGEREYTEESNFNVGRPMGSFSRQPNENRPPRNGGFVNKEKASDTKRKNTPLLHQDISHERDLELQSRDENFRISDQVSSSFRGQLHQQPNLPPNDPSSRGAAKRNISATEEDYSDHQAERPFPKRSQNVQGLAKERRNVKAENRLWEEPPFDRRFPNFSQRERMVPPERRQRDTRTQEFEDMIPGDDDFFEDPAFPGAPLGLDSQDSNAEQTEESREMRKSVANKNQNEPGDPRKFKNEIGKQQEKEPLLDMRSGRKFPPGGEDRSLLRRDIAHPNEKEAHDAELQKSLGFPAMPRDSIGRQHNPQNLGLLGDVPSTTKDRFGRHEGPHGLLGDVPEELDTSKDRFPSAEVLPHSSRFPEETVRDVLKVVGLPRDCKEGHVAHFFHGIRIVPGGILLQFDPVTGEKTGQALVKFAHPIEAERGLECDGAPMNRRPVRVTLCPLEEWKEAEPHIRKTPQSRRPAHEQQPERFGMPVRERPDQEFEMSGEDETFADRDYPGERLLPPGNRNEIEDTDNRRHPRFDDRRRSLEHEITDRRERRSHPRDHRFEEERPEYERPFVDRRMHEIGPRRGERVSQDRFGPQTQESGLEEFPLRRDPRLGEERRGAIPHPDMEDQQGFSRRPPIYQDRGESPGSKIRGLEDTRESPRDRLDVGKSVREVRGSRFSDNLESFPRGNDRRGPGPRGDPRQIPQEISADRPLQPFIPTHTPEKVTDVRFPVQQIPPGRPGRNKGELPFMEHRGPLLHPRPPPVHNGPTQKQGPPMPLVGNRHPRPPAAAETQEKPLNHISTCFELRGLPPDASIKACVQFFEGIQVALGSVFIEKNLDGKPLGSAFLEIANIAQFPDAIAKSGKYMGTRAIEVRSITKDSMNDKIRQAQQRMFTREQEKEIKSAVPPASDKNKPVQKKPEKSDRNERTTSREKDRSRDSEKDRSRVADRERSGDRERGGGRDRDRDRDRDRRDRDRDRERDRDRDRRDRDRERDRERERSREKGRDREGSDKRDSRSKADSKDKVTKPPPVPAVKDKISSDKTQSSKPPSAATDAKMIPASSKVQSKDKPQPLLKSEKPADKPDSPAKPDVKKQTAESTQKRAPKPQPLMGNMTPVSKANQTIGPPKPLMGLKPNSKTEQQSSPLATRKETKPNVPNAPTNNEPLKKAALLSTPDAPREVTPKNHPDARAQAPPLLDNPKDTPPIESNCVLIINVPYNADESDIFHFFEGLTILPGGIHLVRDERGQFAGKAYVEFKTEEIAGKAMLLNGNKIWDRNAVINIVTKDAMLSALAPETHPSIRRPTLGFESHVRGPPPHIREREGFEPYEEDPPMFDPRAIVPRPMRGRGGPRLAGPPSGRRLPVRGNVLSITNLSHAVAFEDLADLLVEYDYLPGSLRMIRGDMGQATGEAMVAFNTPGDAFQAMRDLNNTPFHGRIMRLKVVNP